MNFLGVVNFWVDIGFTQRERPLDDTTIFTTFFSVGKTGLNVSRTY